ncbi:MAG TPA: tetratricopeptide repeat protein, partial [Verrucomicrobiae bacterium]
TQKPGTGFGAACEADDLRHRIYKANGIVENIRVVVFDKDDAKQIPAKLERYHRFHAKKDFDNIVRWLGGKVPVAVSVDVQALKTSIPHNLPTLQPFFGREEELLKIREALDPESRTWGALIDGPGGMGKTSLAVRAAYDCGPGDFKRIIFISLKTRELDDDGVRDLSGFILSGLIELYNELAQQLARDDIAKATEEQRPRLLIEALRDKGALLILDNLESLVKKDRDVLFTFVKRLPQGCKAILTCRGRIGSGAEELILEKLSEKAALQTLAELAAHNPLLAKTSEAERLVLYRETGGKPLLLRWTAGQLGRGQCLTFTDALHFIRSCPPGNDPLEFIFGDLVEFFSEAETKVLCALTYFTQPAKVEHIAAIAGAEVGRAVPSGLPDRTTGGGAVRTPRPTSVGLPEINLALRSLVNRSLAVPSDELKTFTLVPMVADFLRKKKPEVVEETGERLEKRAYALIVENGYQKHARFPVLDAAWPSVVPALPRFLDGSNDRLQTVCLAIDTFLEFTGRWDESLALHQQAEAKAEAAGDHKTAGWRAFQAGWIYYLRGQADAVLACADYAAGYWKTAPANARERAAAIGLRGHGHRMKKDYAAAIAAHSQEVELDRGGSGESKDLATALHHLAFAKQLSGDLDGAEQNYREALGIHLAINDSHGVASSTGRLSELALDREEWLQAEILAREALSLSERLGRQDSMAKDCRCLAIALMRQGKAAEALLYIRRAVEIFSRLGSPDLEEARNTLKKCEEAGGKE